MTNEEKVLERLSKMAKSPLSFRGWFGEKVDGNLLINKKTIEDRVYEIIRLCRSNYTYIGDSEREQCDPGASRSAHDIWRIYKYYFGDIDIFSILRGLYTLSIGNRIESGYCFVVKKRVFSINPAPFDYTDWHPKGELGVSIKEWENIGLGVNNEG